MIAHDIICGTIEDMRHMGPGFNFVIVPNVQWVCPEI